MLAARTAGAPDRGDVLLVHGWPETSRMWEPALAAVAAAGWRATAPDLVGFGDSIAAWSAGGAAWAAQVEALEATRVGRGLDRVVLVVHDWGGLVGLRWACTHPDAVRALVISDTGFFPDAKWHRLAKTLRTPGAGEQAVAALTREAFAAVLDDASHGFSDDAVDEYYRAFAPPVGGASTLELYRSGDMAEIAPFDGALGALGVPTRLVWGADDPFAPLAGAHRFLREIPGAELTVVAGAGHFVWDDDPVRTCAELVAFLDALA